MSALAFKVMKMESRTSLPVTYETYGRGGRDLDGSYTEAPSRAVPMNPMTLATIVDVFLSADKALERERSLQAAAKSGEMYFTVVGRIE